MVTAALQGQRAGSGGPWPQHQDLGTRGGAQAGCQSYLCPLPLTGSPWRALWGREGLWWQALGLTCQGWEMGRCRARPLQSTLKTAICLAAGAGWARKADGPRAIRAGGPHTCRTLGSSAAESPPRRGGAPRPVPEGSCPGGAGQTVLCWTRATGRCSSRCPVPEGERAESGAAARAIPFLGSTDKRFSSHHSGLAKKDITCPADRASRGAHDPPRA